jgi:putative FmdB family regulatory protein
MPLYEYQCEACGNRFEKIVKFSDPPLEECPKCGGKVQKLLSSPAIQFKGSGWYITDYAKKGSSESSSTSKAAAEKSADSKSDTAKSDNAAKSDAAPAPAASTATKE